MMEDVVSCGPTPDRQPIDERRDRFNICNICAAHEPRHRLNIRNTRAAREPRQRLNIRNIRAADDPASVSTFTTFACRREPR